MKFTTNNVHTNMANPTQNMPKVTILIRAITTQNTMPTDCGIQKNNELTCEITRVGGADAKYQVYVLS